MPHGISDLIRDSVSKITAAIHATCRSMGGRIISCRIGAYRGDAGRDSGMAMVSVRDRVSGLFGFPVVGQAVAGPRDYQVSEVRPDVPFPP